MKNEDETKNLPKTTNQSDLLNIEIPQDKIDRVARMADEFAIWVKLVEGGFLFNGEKTVPELQGVLVAVNPHYVMWVDKKPSKIPFDGQDAPEGYELRCDVKLNIDGTVIGLSLPKTSTKAHLSQYLKFLNKSGLQINHVVTRIRSKAVSSPHGKFNVAVFDCVGSVNDLPPQSGSGIPPQAAPATPACDVVDVTSVKTSVPSQGGSATNPWV